MIRYDNDFPSVTSILGVLRKIGLEIWFKRNTAEFCDAESNKGRTVGKVIHEVIQSHIEKTEIELETEYPEEVKNCIKGFFKFKKDYPKIKLKRAEMKLMNKKDKYNGTLDCLGKEGKELFIVDWKTGKCNIGTKKETEVPRVFPEHLYQVAAYVKTYNIANMGNIKKAKILLLAKDKVAYNLIVLTENAIDEMFNEVFLPCLKIYNYQQKEESNNGHKTRQGTGSDSKTSGGRCNPSKQLPRSF